MAQSPFNMIELVLQLGSFGLLAYLAILTARHAPSVIERVLGELEAQRNARDDAERSFAEELRAQRADFKQELRLERALFERKVAAILIAVKEAGPEAIERVADAMVRGASDGGAGR